MSEPRPDPNALATPAFDQADRLRKALRFAGVSVNDMADYLDVSRNTIGRYVNGHATARTQVLRLWALRCGVDYQWLRTGWPSVLPPRVEWEAFRDRVQELREGLTVDQFHDMCQHFLAAHLDDIRANPAESPAAAVLSANPRSTSANTGSTNEYEWFSFLRNSTNAAATENAA